MDQNRPDVGNNSTNHQQNVHLHMHHVCACQGIYPTATATTYYPPLSYRTTPLVPYATAAQTIARPYLQHYQYTQFNVAGGQYNMSAPYSSTGHQTTSANNESIILVPSNRRNEAQESVAVADAPLSEPPADFDYAPGAPIGPPGPPIIPSVADLFLLNPAADELQMNTDNFIKFLERSCLTAEQIAYRNRNRPCFRNIQNLCIRTRSEILKPRTTISNIHSQGIPWATKDFIYAFVRLTNCWHILKGYWENRGGSALGKIEKELTPGFRACYVRWEKETVELATELTRIFYNLDANQSNPAPQGNVHGTNSLIPPQVSLLKPAPAHTVDLSSKDAPAEPLLSAISAPAPLLSKNIRGIIHLPSPPPATVDQANQTCSADCCAPKSAESEDESVVYMKPGSYRVPKKYKKKHNSNSPRIIEFLKTAQNVSKSFEAVNDKYWFRISDVEGGEPMRKGETGDLDAPEVYFNVNEWLSNSNFSDYGDQQSSSSNTPPKMAEAAEGGDEEGEESDGKAKLSQQIASRTYRRKACDGAYELKSGGLSKRALTACDKMLAELMDNECASLFAEGVLSEYGLEAISRNLGKGGYRYVNEVIRDLRLLVNNASLQFKKCEMEKLRIFSQKIEVCLAEYFPNCDFSLIVGKKGEKVGKLKQKNALYDGDGDYLKNA